MGLGCISFLIGGALKYVLQSNASISIQSSPIYFDELQWLQLIVNNRPSYSEDVTTLSDINDIRNGLFAMEQIHLAFDPRRVAILKVCHICPPIFLLIFLLWHRFSDPQSHPQHD